MATLIRSDLDFILQQILISEAHAAGADLTGLVPNAFAPFGLRTVDGTYNNLVAGQQYFGAADQPFSTLADGTPYPSGIPGPGGALYSFDSQPRVISNLVADMTSSNPAAVSAYVDAGLGTLDADGTLLDLDGNVVPPGTLLTIPNTAPDVGLSAPFNSWFTFFGQFFDHGLDLVNKSGSELVFMPLQPDDPLYVPGSPTNFMVVSRATRDAEGNATNQTTPFVDQNQTYTSHASHQVFLREYALDADGRPVATGNMLGGADGGLATWADIKAQARDLLGIELDDMDVLNVPLLATDPYGKFIPDPATGFPQVVISAGPPPVLQAGTPTSPIDGSLGVRIGHAFLDDIAHTAKPVSSSGAPLAADADAIVGDPALSGQYDNELLDRHFITGDGRGNENIALTAVHHIFHGEHNKQVNDIKATVMASEDPEFIASWHLPDGSWNGERLFQAARFATEMQYQHLVFEEFARKVLPTIDAFLAPTGYDAAINPAIFGEFAHAVYRLGHSMLTETVDRLDPNFESSSMSLLDAFLNPVAFNDDGALTAEQAAGAIVRGMTRQVGNEIDEFVTDAVRNTLLGLPLDLAAINIARGRDTGVPTLNEARREFYEMTSDSQLKPYTSWLDLTQNLKHEASVVNFIAAYGTHAELTSADVNTVEEKRAVAMALVFGGEAVINEGTASERTFVADEDDRVDFLTSSGIYANAIDGITTTGVDDIDLWIGGLAERTMPFGSMLGSTFGFVFETQLEGLQNGDRFYYLSRLAGLNFLTEMENGSFSKLVMRNTDCARLPADIFSTPAWTLEANQNVQFTGLGDDGRDDPTEGGTALLPLVIRDDPDTAGQDAHYVQYTGGDHVVLGGTAGNDTLIGSIGDDTAWGDAGNDRLEGGAGNDNLEGGDGDDIITDMGGDDVLKGNAGNDVIQGGQGFNLILGGDGSDFIITGEDVSETFGGQGNDFILGSQMNLPTFGNEGDDWIEIGTSDGASGDNFDPQEASTILGHDVFITGGGFDEADGEGGDDIMVFSDGADHFGGGGGFDWASYANDPLGVQADLLVNDRIEPPVTPSNQGILDRYADVEGLSGSAHNDFLRGDDADATAIAIAGPLNGTLTDVGLYANLQPVLGAGVTTFNAGNILLGGSGSDLIEGRGGNDIIDGDRYLNVRISVRDAGGAEIRSVASLTELVPDMLAGTINPSQLVIVREILTGADDFDTAMFTGNLAEYTITTAADGTVTVAHTIDGGVTIGIDGIDTVRNVERLQFSDQNVVLAGGNADPVGQLTVDDTTPAINQVLTASAAGVTDADGITQPIGFVWQSETVAGSGLFRDIVTLGGGVPESATGDSLVVTADLDGLALRVRAVYQDGHGVFENVFSAATAAVTGAAAAPPDLAAPPAETAVATDGIHLIRADLQFMLDQIKISEIHSGQYGTPSEDLRSLLPNTRLPFGVRTVDGSDNNLVPGQEQFGAADESFPFLLDQVFRNDADGDQFDANGPAPGGLVTNNNYATTTSVADADPRIISNLISDQTASNPAAVIANGGADPVMSPGMDGLFGTADDRPVFFIPNTAPDEGLSAQFNSWFTFFGQFFDHGLDLVDKGGNGTIYIPLEADDPLVAGADGQFGTADDLAAHLRFMVVTRATNGTTDVATQAGADGVLNTADDVHFHNNQTTPFIDQNQTYTSHASHQVFLREYARDADGPTVTTGRLLEGVNGGIANWAEVKANAQQYLGIILSDIDALDVPLLATDAYGKFIPGANGYAQVVTNLGLVEGTAAGLDIHNLPGGAIFARTGHPFLADIAHTATPLGLVDHDRNPGTGAVQGTADGDDVAGNPIPVNEFGVATTYDDELLDAHFITGDGRGNENIGLTAVHFIFHAEHNRLVDHIKEVIEASNDPAFIAEWHLPDGSWNGERLFQAARFSTEMQYQHLVFEEFGRKVQPQIDVFLAEGQGYDSTIDASIVAEFAHVVYRFGHSMLTETVDRFDADFSLVNSNTPLTDDERQMGLIEAFLNPLAFTASGAGDAAATGAIVRGLTRQAGNEIDEFVTEALRNNLLGLPLDLPAINIARGRDTGVPTLNQARAQFFEWTGDTQLKPYESWADLAGNLKHEASLVNFIAAYGTHASITTAETNAERRAAAYALVYGEGGLNGIVGDGDDATVAVPTDRLAFLNGPAATTGVNAIDLWIGGLAEKIMPFGGLLGSTFNYVFENQMEKLQNGDRFYYLERTAALNFLTELESNTFSKLIMANTDATHLPGDVFSTPGFTLEVNSDLQFTGLGVDGRDDPEGDVTRDNPETAGPDSNYLRYNGDQHVVLGGTAGADIMIASEGDDTLWGDEGDDRLEGGFGNDFVMGGAGDDIMTDIGGDDNMQGGDGNDAIHGGQGINLILGGFGNDFIDVGRDENEAFGGGGNDFIHAARATEMIFGGEGDDWLEHGLADGSAGENFDVRGFDSIIGHDVFIGDSISDRMLGEGGDDIMVGNGGQIDRYMGSSGFDWASFAHPTVGANADLNLRAVNEVPTPLSVASTQNRFDSVEGMSGSAFADVLIGDNFDALTLPTSGFTGSVLTNFSLIDGLQSFVGEGITSFSAGNIILGGGGSDILEGRGGDDLIDGDKWLNVRISVRENRDGTGEEIATSATMAELADEVFAGIYNPGQLVIVREILDGGAAGDFDTATFTGLFTEYDIDFSVPGQITVTHNLDVDGVIVIGGGADGVDRLTGIERLQFADVAVEVDGFNAMPEGLVTINDETPVSGELLTASAAGVTDEDNVTDANPTGAITGPISYIWQVELQPASGIFSDIVIPAALGDLIATGTTFMPGPAESGLSIRVKAVYQDAHGVINAAYSAPTAAVGNGAPAGTLRISDSTPTEGTAVSAINRIVDPDGNATSVFSYQWQQSDFGGGGAFTDIAGATGVSFTPGAAQVDRALRVVATYTDDVGGAEIVVSPGTTVTGDLIAASTLAQILTGTAGQDDLSGGAGADTLNGLGENDLLDGGAGNDALNGGDGNDTLDGGAGADTIHGDGGDDTINYNVGDLADSVDGGAGQDRLNIVTTGTVNTTVIAAITGGVLTSAAGNSLVSVESVTADLGAGTDTLSYAGAGPLDGVRVDLTAGTASGFTSIAGFENVIGGAGNDHLTGVEGAINVFTGGAGNDTFVVHDTGDVTSEAALGGTDEVQSHAFAYTLASNVENLSYAGWGNFTGTGNTLGNVLTGGRAHDVLDGAGGNDTLHGGFGQDTLVGGSGDDVLNGGFGNDALDGGIGNDALDGGAGDDTLHGGTGNDIVLGGGGNDTVTYTTGDGIDLVDGGAGSDTLQVTGTDLANTLTVDATGGVLAIVAGSTVTNVESVTADLRGEVDTLSYAGTTDGVTADLGAGTATGFTSITNIENLTGGSGNDSLIGAAGVLNTLSGGAGNDTLVVHDTDDVATGDAGTDLVQSLANVYTLGSTTTENLTFTGTGIFTGTGNAVANVITGGAGDDLLSGLGGNDTLDGGAGTDTLDGGTGNDTFVVDVTADVIVEAAAGGTDEVHSTATTYTLSNENVENLRFTGTGDFTGTGNLVANVITGGDGADTLSGLAGNDTLNGGSGDDTLSGGDGVDILNGEAGNDTLVGGLGNDRVNGGEGDDTSNYVIGDGADVMDGGAGSDTLNVNGNVVDADETLTVAFNGGELTAVAGGAVTAVESVTANLQGGTDTLSYAGSSAGVTVNLGTGQASGFTTIAGIENVTGGTGADTLISATGIANVLTGGAGNDTYVVHDDADTEVEGANAGIDETQSYATTRTLSNNVENLTFVGTGAFTGIGNTLDNVITGGLSGDTLSGLAGNDTLSGGLGDDTLVGGLGNDRVNGGDGNDTATYTLGDGADIVDGGGGDDTFSVTGSAGANTLTVTYDGGALSNVEGTTFSSVESITADLLGGTDTLSYGTTTADVTVDLDAGSAVGFTSIAGIENVTGGSGNDVLTGSAVVNVLDGAAGNDRLSGGGANDVLRGGDGNDTINYTIGEGADTVDGGADTDTLNVVGTGADESLTVVFNGTVLASVAGGAVSNVEAVNVNLQGGTDTLSYAGSTVSVTVDLGTATGASGIASLAGVENVTGGTAADHLTSAADLQVNTLSGGAGNDTLVVRESDDVTVGDTGIDLVESLANSYTLTGTTTENLTFTGGSGDFSGTGSAIANVITGGAGNDTLAGLAGNDTLIGADGNDTLDGGLQNDTLIGGAGSDSLLGGDGLDSLDGGADNDALSGGTGNDALSGGEGDDNLSGGDGVDALDGGAGNDTLSGGTANDTVNGGDGDDTINYSVGDGSDAVDGGIGNDRFNYTGNAVNNVLTVAVSAGVLTNVGGNALTNVESVVADLQGNSTALGDTLSYAGATESVSVDLGTGLVGSATGFTSIHNIENATGGTVNDVLTSASDGVINTLTGGTGDDTYVMRESQDVAVEGGLGGGIDEVQSTANVYVLGANVENLTFIGSGDFTGSGNTLANVITGGTGNDLLSGNSGDDAIFGGVGNDTLNGDAGLDTLVGGAGNDFINGGAGNDTIQYSIGDGADTMDGGLNLDTLVVTGTAGDDTLGLVFSGTALTQVEGGTVTGVESVTAVLQGGADTLSYAGSTAAVSVNLEQGSASGFTSIASVENVTGGAGNDLLTGSAGANTIDGSFGNDTISAGDGDDTVNYSIGGGADAVDGDAGTDALNITGDAGDDTLGVVVSGGAVASVAGGSVTGIESVTANLHGGSDTVSYVGTTEGVTVNLAAGTASGLSSFSGIENVTGGSGDDVLAGDAGANSLAGGDGSDVLAGGAGDDTVNGGAGNDAVNYTIGDGADSVDGGAGTDTLNITGGAAADTLGVVVSAGVVTSVAGGSVAGIESVTANLDGGSDTLSYAGTTEGVTVNLAAGTASGLSSFSGIENVTGGSGDDVLAGDAGANSLAGGDGSDTVNYSIGGGADSVDGGADTDTLNISGGAGDDTLGVVVSGGVVASVAGGSVAGIESVTANLDGGSDTLSYAGTTEGVTVNLAAGTASGLSSFSGIENVTGGSGDDVLAGDAGANSLAGGDGNDTLNYGIGGGADSVDGGTGIDTLNITGGAGDDTLGVLVSAGVVASVAGGSVAGIESVTANLDGGSDTLSYAGTTEGVAVNLAAGTASALSSFSGIENVTGGSGDDTLAGDVGSNSLSGGDGNDTVNYSIGGGADSVDGGADSDTLNISGGAGDDTLGMVVSGGLVASVAGGSVVNVEAVTANLDGGSDTLDYSGTTEGVTVNLAAGTASGLSSFSGIENVTGGSGDDTLAGDVGSNSLVGGAGNDTVNYSIGGGADSVDGGAGVDAVNITGTTGANTLDVVYDGTVLSHVAAGTVTGVESVTADLLAGTDTLSYAGSAAAVVVNLSTGQASGFTAIAGVENVVGGSGDDVLTSAIGLTNTLTGGMGDDTYVMLESADRAFENLDEGTDEVQSVATSYTLAANVENLTFIGSGDFIGTGNNLDNVVTGGAGNDTLSGLGGNDTLHGGAGNDTLDGGTGDDTIHGGEGDDTINYTFGQGADAVDGGAGLDGGTGNDTLNIVGTAGGNSLNVVVTGGVLTSVAGGSVAGVEAVTADLQGGVDTLNYSATTESVTVDLGGAAEGFDSIANIENVVGGSGDDHLASSVGITNTLTGGAGNDTFVVHETADVVSEVDATGIDQVLSHADSYTITDAQVENLTYAGSGNFTGTGNASANVITGGAGNDTLSGLGGNDTLRGGAGNDTLDGGTGDDTIEGGEGDDTINYTFGQGADAVDGGTGLDGGIGSDTLNVTGNDLNNALNVAVSGGVLTHVAGGSVVGIETVNVDLHLGVDTLSYAGATESVTVDLHGGTASGIASLTNVENVVGGMGNDHLTSDEVTVNILSGGAGDDTYVVRQTTDIVNESIDEGTDEVQSVANAYTLTDPFVENLSFIGAGSFTGAGNSSANVITGGGGDDSLSGLAGNDMLHGGAGGDALDGGIGSDTLEGGGGDDMLHGGAGDDTVRGGDGDDTVNHAVGDGLDAIDGGSGSDRLNYTGTTGNNVLTVAIAGGVLTSVAGNSLLGMESIVADLGDGTDTLSYAGATEAVNADLAGTGSGSLTFSHVENVIGGDGSDVLTSAADGIANVLTGGLGDDTFVVRESNDVASEIAAGGTDEVQSLADSYTITNLNVENLRYIGGASFTGTGNDAANVITGGDSADVLSGLGGNDTLVGGAGGDTLDGGTGDDTLEGDAGHDVLAGGIGNDTLRGGDGNDTFNYTIGEGADGVDGGAGTDRLNITGTALVNVLNVVYAGTLTQVAGGTMAGVEEVTADLLALSDTLDYTTTSAAVTVNLGTGAASGFLSISSIENVTGGSGNDLLTGSAGVVNTLTGGGGDDTFVVQDTGDIVSEALDGGTDEVQSLANAYTITNVQVENLRYNGGAAFTGTGNASANVITGGGGNDVLSGLGGNDTLNGGEGNDALDGGANDDTLNGGAGNDTLVGGLGNDAVNGGDGDDTVNYGVNDGTDTVDGGAGNDRLNVTGTAANNALNVVLVGSLLTNVGGNTVTNVEAVTADLLDGTGDGLNYTTTTAAVTVNLGAGAASGFLSIANIENVTGGSGNDFLTGSAGVVNTLTGGAGNDTFVVQEATDVVSELAGGGIDEVQSAGNAYTITNAQVENLRFIGAGVFAGTGNNSANVITGGDGMDTLLGMAGNDTLNGGAGNDILDGGIGNDAVNGGAGNDTINYTSNEGADAVDGGADADTLVVTGTALANSLVAVFNGTALSTVAGGTVTNVESVTANLLAGVDSLSYLGTTVAVQVNLGTGSASGFSSISGIENVTGGSGNDVLASAADAQVNTLAGGAGDDTFVIRELGDVATELALGGTDLVQSHVDAYTLGVNVDNLVYMGTGNFLGTGNDQANVIIGGVGNDTLLGLGGSDTMLGLAGNDVLDGGSGDNIVEGGAGVDRISGGSGNDRLDGGTEDDTLDGDSGNDTVNGGDGNDVLLGGAGGDSLTGGTGNDTLDGGAGTDLLNGGTGNDALNSGQGDDILIFQASFGQDTVSEFDPGPPGGQDRMDISALGIVAGDFGTRVVIAVFDANADGTADHTRVTIDTSNSIVLFGINGTGDNVITQADFILA